MKVKSGKILKGIGGFYYVETDDGIYECKARGIFRQKNLKPLVGDNVEITIDENSYTISEVMDRKNSFIRPPVANLDNLIIVSSVREPTANPLIIDKMIALAVHKKIKPILVISKSDLEDGLWLKEIYDKAKVENVLFSSITGEGADKVHEFLHGNVSVFTGNSGVGKSSLLNCLFEDLSLDTGKVSKKLGRGRHTTRKVELFKIDKNSYVADTPGFSTLELSYFESLEKEDLQHCFSEFSNYIDFCRFTSCTHICEKGCAVIEAVKNNKISKSRFDSYVTMYNDIKNVRKW